MHISVSNFAAIFNKLQAYATTSTKHFLGSSRKNFFLIFLQEFFFWAVTFQIRSKKFGTKFTKTNIRSGFLSKNHPISKKKRVESEFGCGRYCWFKISYLIRIFVTAKLLQRKSEISECLDKDFHHMGRCKMVLLLPKIGYNKYSELYWLSYAHFNFGATFGVGSHWRRALPPHFSRHLLHIHQFQHSSIRLGLFGDVQSHPRLCRHLLLHQQPTSWLWVNRIKFLSSKSIC